MGTTLNAKMAAAIIAGWSFIKEEGLGQLDGLHLAAIVQDRWPPVRILVASGRDFVAKTDLPVDGRFFAKPYSSAAVISSLNEMLAAA